MRFLQATLDGAINLAHLVDFTDISVTNWKDKSSCRIAVTEVSERP